MIQDRILAKLPGARIRVVAADDPLADVAPAHSTTEDPSIDPQTPGAAGPIVADAAAMIVFERAWASGRLLKTATLRTQLEHLYPMFDQPLGYGLGVMVYELPPPNAATSARVWVGHSGGAPGVKAAFAYSITDGAFVAVALTGDGSAEATANLLLRALH